MVEDAAAPWSLGSGQRRAEEIEGVLDHPVDTRWIPLGSAIVEIERDGSPHRVPVVSLHLVHDLALELLCRPLTGRAFTGGLDRHVDDELAMLAAAPPEDPELLGNIPCQVGPITYPFIYAQVSGTWRVGRHLVAMSPLLLSRGAASFLGLVADRASATTRILVFASATNSAATSVVFPHGCGLLA